MNRTLDNLLTAFAIVGIFVFLGLVGAGLWHLFELATGYTDTIVRMAGY